MKRIRTVFTYLLCFTLIVIFGGVIVKLTRTGRDVYMRSDSPDGNYTCVVLERRARWPKDSPNLYLFSIHKQGSEEPLHGGSKLINKDSVVIGRLEFAWQAGRLGITEDGNPLLTATISNNLQSWVDHALYVAPK